MSAKKAKTDIIKSSNDEFSTDWDIDYYKTQHESEEHWHLRRKFMEVHKKSFPEENLVCLAQVFTNMEFMGCKYPAKTMHRVAELSKDLAKEFRAKRATKLKRTFVTASDAAEMRAKARRTNPQQQQHTQVNKRAHFGFSMEQPQSKKEKNSHDFFADLPFGKFVLSLSGGRNCIRFSAQRSNIEFQEKEIGELTERKKVEIYLGGKLVTSAQEENIKLSKITAFNNALKVLQRSCYTIKPNPLRDTIKVNKSKNEVVCNVTKQQTDVLEDKKLDASNKGYKMMKMMGWSGGGLGSKTQGREEPVGYLLKNNRAGLGNNEVCKLDRKYFTQMLKNYIESDDIRELQFEPTFAKDERAMLHEIANKFNLKSNSYGKNEDRRLVISKKNISDALILTEILMNQNSRYYDKYFVQVPECKEPIYPEFTARLELDV